MSLSYSENTRILNKFTLNKLVKVRPEVSLPYSESIRTLSKIELSQLAKVLPEVDATCI